jgi:DNA-binding NtrC family response regulator
MFAVALPNPEFPSIAAQLSAANRVLVVEDEARLRDMLSRALQQMGFSATLAPTAEAANKALREAPFDIVILDLNLPGMDGMEFLRLIRQRGSEIQVIILTGFGDLEAAKSAIRLDVVDFLTKPYALGTLEVALDRARKRIRERLLRDLPAEPLVPFEGKPAPPAPLPAFEETSSAAEALEEVERRQILRVLQKHGGNRAQTAAELGISVRKLYYRLGEYQRKGFMSE